VVLVVGRERLRPRARRARAVGRSAHGRSPRRRTGVQLSATSCPLGAAVRPLGAPSVPDVSAFAGFAVADVKLALAKRTDVAATSSSAIARSALRFMRAPPAAAARATATRRRRSRSAGREGR
jgi:hypothetical protein